MGLPYSTNRGLFSDHYLAIRLPEQLEWEGDYRSLRTRLSALLDEKADALPTLSEAQTEQQFIRPVLDALGWSYETQITFRALGRDYRPDYALFLEQNGIADRHLAEAIMLLTRHAETQGDYSHPEFIDFRDLGVRHLGSVYEGLLEFKLNVADSHLVKASGKGKPVWKPCDDPAKADKKPGELYLTNDKRERKATGSYYTPDYIVRYIVENTVGPQIDRIEREHELARQIGASQEERRPWDEFLDEVLEGKPADEARAARELWDGLKSSDQRRQFLLNQLEGVQPEHGYDPPTRVLGLKVLDPALGSGHFLVGALDYMTTRLAAMLNEHVDSPVFERIREDRRKIVESLKKQGIHADEG